MILAASIPFLFELVALTAVCLIAAYLCLRIGLVPIAGFLIAGAIIGPNGLGIVYEQELVDMLAEVGIVLLLFAIGVEFSLGRLARIGRTIFLAGTVQVGLTTAIIALVTFAIGANLGTSIYTGLLCSLSSTAIVLGLLSERNETNTPVGRLSTATLIFQDLMIVVMVLVVPLLAGGGTDLLEFGRVLGTAVLLIVGALFLARRAVPWALEHIALTRRSELFLLTILGICFGVTLLASIAGVSLSLGAFLAGLIVSESRFSEQALSEIIPFKTIFNAVFFVSVGMLLDVRFILQEPVLLATIVAVVVVVKVIASTIGGRIAGNPIGISLASGFILAQIGEFSFVLERAGRIAGLSPGGFGEMGEQAFIASTVILMLATPALFSISDRYTAWKLRRRGVEPDEEVEPSESFAALENHVIVVGLGIAGERLVQILREQDVPVGVIELNVRTVNRLLETGVPVIRGDGSRRSILKAARADHAKTCVIVINDPEAVPRIVANARDLNPSIQILVRTHFAADVERLKTLGADVVVPEELETAITIFANVLSDRMVPQEQIEAYLSMLRQDDYRIWRDPAFPIRRLQGDWPTWKGSHTRIVRLREGSPAADSTLEELGLRQQYGLTLLTVDRDGKTVTGPGADFQLKAGDRALLLGDSEAFKRAGNLFRDESGP